MEKAIDEILKGYTWSDGGVLPTVEPSIWAMELPNESYRAPMSAFWWVSNEPTK